MRDGSRPEKDGLPGGFSHPRARAIDLLRQLGTGGGGDDLVDCTDDVLIDRLADAAQRDGSSQRELAEQALEELAGLRLYGLGRSILATEHLLLDLDRLVDLAMTRLLFELHAGLRLTPASRWVRRIIEQVISWARFDPKFHLDQNMATTPAQQAADRRLTRMINELDLLSRQIIFLSWNRCWMPDKVADALQLPLEEVECILENVIRAAMRLSSKPPAEEPDEAGSADFWKAMGQEGQDHGQE